MPGTPRMRFRIPSSRRWSGWRTAGTVHRSGRGCARSSATGPECPAQGADPPDGGTGCGGIGVVGRQSVSDLERVRLRRRLEAALGELTDVQRTVVLMHDLEGYRHREIAVELGMPEGTVRSHLFFARRALRERLGDSIQPEQTDG
jgi:RNA polymerase sigma factor (sigma-70 family)